MTSPGLPQFCNSLVRSPPLPCVEISRHFLVLKEVKKQTRPKENESDKKNEQEESKGTDHVLSDRVVLRIPFFRAITGDADRSKNSTSPPPTTNSTPSSIPAEAAAETPAQLTDKESTFTYGAEMDFNSRYVWRGLLLDDGPVGQPSAWISAFGFTFTACGQCRHDQRIWGHLRTASTSAAPASGNAAMTSASGVAGLNSGGLTMTYDRDWEKLRLEAELDAYMGRMAQTLKIAIRWKAR